MKKIIIIPNINKDNVFDITRKASAVIRAHGAEVFIDRKYGDCYGKFSVLYSEFPSDCDLIIVIGGDGSVIDASVLAVQNDIPLLGINLGNLGYLTEVEPDSLDILEKLFSGDFVIDNKMLLSVAKSAEGSATKYSRYAVNDVIISHEDFLGIADFKLITDAGESVKYRADGIIFATPVGSTAYSLSAGGPIVDHGINSIVATPICPHSFFNRSIIFNEKSVLKIKNTGNSELKISIDGRLFERLNTEEECIVSASNKKLKMLAFNSNNMFATLFSKMKKI